jgi:hypothetical protein
MITMLFCIVFLINGCNSLISQFFGTHKLRTFSMEQALSEGIGDSDYVTLTGAWQSGDYIVVPPRTGADKAILIFPILSNEQMRNVEAGKKVKPVVIGWTKNFSLDCDLENTCAPRLQKEVSGIVRDMQQQKNKAHMLATDKYELPEEVVYLEVDRQPLAWYWNLLMILGSFGLAYVIEARANRRKEITGVSQD